MNDSTVLILTSVCFNILTVNAAITGAPVIVCAAICFTGVITLGLGFYNLANYN
jgi:hypothetical protein